MRIALVANTAWYVVNFRLNLIKSLLAEGHEVVVCAPADAVHASKVTQCGAVFVPVAISGSGTNPLREAQVVTTLWQAFRQHGVELVLSYTPKGNLYSSLASIALGIPFVPNISGLGRSFIQTNWVTAVVKLLYRFTLKRARRVFFQNNDDLGLFVQLGLVNRERCERLPGSGVDLQRFTPQAFPSDADSAPVFLLIARLMWDKGVGEYAEAAQRVKTRFPNATFQLLGFLDVDNPSAVSRAQVEAWEAEGRLSYLGKTDDIRPYLAAATCVVLPSYREGVPRTLLEAAASARPIVTTDAPGCRDTVLDGKTGFLCKPADGQDLAKKILAFLDLSVAEQAAMGEAGRKRIEAEFDERLVIEAYHRVVRSVMSKTA